MKKIFKIKKGEDIDDLAWNFRDMIDIMQTPKDTFPFSKGDYVITVEIKKLFNKKDKTI